MKECTKCGYKTDADNEFCPTCGTILREAAPSDSPTENTTNPTEFNLGKETRPINDIQPQMTGAGYSSSYNGGNTTGSGMSYKAVPHPYLEDTCPTLFKIFESNGLGRWLNHDILIVEGRINRWKYVVECIKYGIFNFIIAMLLLIIPCVLGAAANSEGLMTLLIIPAIILMIPLSVGSFMLGIRRLHDLDRSGWIVLLTLIPYLNCALSVYLIFFKGTEGDNQYGPDPLQNL